MSWVTKPLPRETCSCGAEMYLTALNLQSQERQRASFREAHAECRSLRRAITEHRTAIHNAGTIKVQPGYEEVAEAKHRADERLWEAVGSAPTGSEA